MPSLSRSNRALSSGEIRSALSVLGGSAQERAVIEQAIKQAAHADAVSTAEDLRAEQAGLRYVISADDHVEKRSGVAITLTKIDIDQRAFVSDEAAKVTEFSNADKPALSVALSVEIHDRAQAFAADIDG
jgi:hypothetical protein